MIARSSFSYFIKKEIYDYGGKQISVCTVGILSGYGLH